MTHSLDPIFIIDTLVFLSFAAAGMAWHAHREEKRRLLFSRLRPWVGRETLAEEPLSPSQEKLNRPLRERLLRPLLKQAAAACSRWMPAQKKASLQQRLLRAGNPWRLSAGEFIALQYALAVFLALAALLTLNRLSLTAPQAVSLSLLAGAAGFLLPETILKKRIRSRREEALRQLPNTLDLLMASIEAGMGFDGALQKVGEKNRGVLGEEFQKTLREIQMGIPRREALRNLGIRLDCEELQRIISSIIQADQMGVSMGSILRIQSAQLRQQRRQKAEERAAKAPIMMLFPLVFFIFPALFAVLLGPAIIQVAASFKW